MALLWDQPIVPLIIVQDLLQMLIVVETHFVAVINLSFGIAVVFVIVKIEKLVIPWPVIHIVMIGTNIHSPKPNQAWLGFVEC